MSSSSAQDVAVLLEERELDLGLVEELAQQSRRDPAQAQRLREIIGTLEAEGEGKAASSLRVGVCHYLLGHYAGAAEVFRRLSSSVLASFLLGQSLMAMGEHEEAVKALTRAYGHGMDSPQVAMELIGALRLAGKTDKALALLEKAEPEAGGTADYFYQLGCCLEEQHQRSESIEAFERAVQIDPTHSGALFRLAYLNDMNGNDAEALELYQRVAENSPTYVNALINLGVLYEDRAEFVEAEQCLVRVLRAHPDHPRARLFLKDARDSRYMYYDEDAEKKHDRFAQVLQVPVTDFELSVRSRNCLKKMNIHNLGDLTRTTEAQLLASKNFGETSLQEIKLMLGSKGLRLGQFVEDKEVVERVPGGPEEAPPPADQSVLGKPIADLELSVRSRKCMARLGIATVGDLASKTEGELLEIKNFGMTSLNEVRQKLGELGLTLRGS